MRLLLSLQQKHSGPTPVTSGTPNPQPQAPPVPPPQVPQAPASQPNHYFPAYKLLSRMMSAMQVNNATQKACFSLTNKAHVT